MGNKLKSRRHNPLMPREDQRNGHRERKQPSRDEYPEDQRGDAWEPAPPDEDGTATPLPTLAASDLLAMQLPPPRWAVEDILPEGLSLLAGKPKLGKSWLALHLAMAVSAGGIALGRILVEGGSVLNLALEDTKRRLQSRIRRLMGPDEQASPRLHLATDWPRMDKGGADAIGEWIKGHPDTRLVIIDTWAKFRPIRPGRTENNYDIDYADGAHMKAIADKHSLSILIVHHCRKMAAADAIEEVSGSVGLTGSCDGVLVLRRERGQHDASLIVTGRDVDEAELALTFDKSHCLWQLIGDAEDFRMSKERTEVIEALRVAGRHLKPSELAPLIEKSTNATKKILWRMAQDGQVAAVGTGSYALVGEPREPRNRRNRFGS